MKPCPDHTLRIVSRCWLRTRDQRCPDPPKRLSRGQDGSGLHVLDVSRREPVCVWRNREAYRLGFAAMRCRQHGNLRYGGSYLLGSFQQSRPEEESRNASKGNMTDLVLLWRGAINILRLFVPFGLELIGRGWFRALLEADTISKRRAEAGVEPGPPRLPALDGLREPSDAQPWFLLFRDLTANGNSSGCLH